MVSANDRSTALHWTPDMCEPMALIGLLGAGISAMGQMQAAQAQSDAANYQAAVDRNNAITAQQNAQDARRRGDQAAEEQQRKTAAIEGRQRAAMAANGIELTSGSPVDVLADTATFGELDRQTVLNNAEREARGYEAQRMNFNSSAGLNKMKADNASSAGSLGALSSLVNGSASALRGSTVASSWFKMS